VVLGFINHYVKCVNLYYYRNHNTYIYIDILTYKHNNKMHRERAPDSLGKARWESSTKTALIQRVRGKQMGTKGFSSRLFPEEVVFLTDRDEIELCELVDGDKEIPIQGARLFAILDEAKIDMKTYTTYSVLCEQHFHVFRRGAWKCPKDKFVQLPTPQVCRTGVKNSNQTTTTSSSIETTINNSTSSSSSSSSSSNNNNSSNNKRQRVVVQSGETDDETGDVLTLAFDCYMPQSGFSKNNMGKPTFSLAIFSASGTLPSVIKLKELISQADEGVPVRLAIVGDSSISFIEISDFDPFSQAARLDVDVKR
jgi:hypothetical protein